MPRRRQNLRSSLRSHDVAFVDHGFSAPPAIDREDAGRTGPRSRSTTRPKPRHAPHAPSGLLNEKRFGTGPRTAKPQAAHSSMVEKRIIAPPPAPGGSRPAASGRTTAA